MNCNEYSMADMADIWRIYGGYGGYMADIMPEQQNIEYKASDEATNRLCRETEYGAAIQRADRTSAHPVFKLNR